MNKKALNTLAANVTRLSNLLTRERATLPLHYLRDKDLREAYIRYFLPVNLYKIHVPLRELSLHPGGIFRKERLRILDLGSGPGTAILGVMNFISAEAGKPSLEFTAVDPIEENLKDAEKLFRSFKEYNPLHASLITLKSRIERTKSHPQEPFDLLILSNVLSEVFHPFCHLELVSVPQTMPGQGILKQVQNDREAGMTGRLDYRMNLLLSLIKRSLASDG